MMTAREGSVNEQEAESREKDLKYGEPGTNLRATCWKVVLFQVTRVGAQR
jgi:hypothetical protein